MRKVGKEKQKEEAEERVKKKKAPIFSCQIKISQLTKGKEPEKELMIYFLRL